MTHQLVDARDPGPTSRSARAIVATVFFAGCVSAAVVPIQSVFVIGTLELDRDFYAIVHLTGSLLSVVMALGVGFCTDMGVQRRVFFVTACLFGVLALVSMAIFPSLWSWYVLVLLGMPAFNTLNTSLLASLREKYPRNEQTTFVRHNRNARMAFSLSWAVTPLLVGMTISALGEVRLAWAFATLLALFALLTMTFSGLLDRPTEEIATQTTPKSKRGSSQGIGPKLFISLLATSMILASLRLGEANIPLIVVRDLGGTYGDVGWIVGSIAFLEIIFMPLWARFQIHYADSALLCVAGTIYAFFAYALATIDSIFAAYFLVCIGAFGAAGVFMVSISYLQSLLDSRAGLGSALLTVVFFGGNVIAMILLGVFDDDYLYGTSAKAGAIVSCIGALILFILSRRGSRSLFRS